MEMRCRDEFYFVFFYEQLKITLNSTLGQQKFICASIRFSGFFWPIEVIIKFESDDSVISPKLFFDVEINSSLSEAEKKCVRLRGLEKKADEEHTNSTSFALD